MNQSWSEYWWNNPPAPFNPNFHPMASRVFQEVVERLWQEPEFKAMSREDRSETIKREYEYEMERYR